MLGGFWKLLSCSDDLQKAVLPWDSANIGQSKIAMASNLIAMGCGSSSRAALLRSRLCTVSCWHRAPRGDGGRAGARDPGTHALQGPERSSRIGKDASYTPLLLRVDMIFKLLGTARSKQPTTARLWKMLDGRLWLWGEQGSM